MYQIFSILIHPPFFYPPLFLPFVSSSYIACKGEQYETCFSVMLLNEEKN